MELLFIGLYGAVIGLAARYALPERTRHGAVLVPAIGAASALVIWVALTWVGLKWDGGWIWVYAVVGAAVVTALADLLIGSARKRSDATLAAAIAKGAAAAA